MLVHVCAGDGCDGWWMQGNRGRGDEQTVQYPLQCHMPMGDQPLNRHHKCDLRKAFCTVNDAQH